MPMDRYPAPVPPTNASIAKTREAIIPVRARVRDGQIVSLLDQAGNEMGLPVTATPSGSGLVEYGPSGKPSRFTAQIGTPNSGYGTTSRLDLGSITIPQEICLPGAYIKGWVEFSGNKDLLAKTFIVAANEAGAGLYGATDIFNAALTPSGNPFEIARFEFFGRVVNQDTLMGGLYSSSSGLGQVVLAASKNPVIAAVNMRGGGLDIAFGGNVASAPTASVDISLASPGVVTHTAHGKSVGQPVSFASAPAGLTSGRVYFIASVIDANTYTVSETKGGPAMNTTASATGITATYQTVLTLLGAHIEVTL